MGRNRGAELGIDRFKLGKRFLCGFEPAVEIGKAALDGLLQHPVRVLVFLQLRLHRGEVDVEGGDFGAALIGLDQLARGLLSGLVERNLDFTQLDGELGAELILVGLDIVQGHRHGRLEPARGELHRAVPERRSEREREQASQEEAKRPK